MKILKYFAYFVLFVYMIIFFLPKANLYYKLEELLSKKEIYISNEKIKVKPLGIDIKDMDIYFGDEKIGHIAHISLDIYLFIDALKIEDISLDLKSIKYLPKSVDTIKASYSILKPKIISIKITQKGVNYDGRYDLFAQKFSIVANISKHKKIHQSVLKYFKKSKKGIYKYEKTIKLY